MKDNSKEYNHCLPQKPMLRCLLDCDCISVGHGQRSGHIGSADEGGIP